MGKSATKRGFLEENLQLFDEKLFHETTYLHSLFAHNTFEKKKTKTLGLELEACLLKESHEPAPNNSEFIKNMFSDHICSELARFNFEVNTDPYPVHEKCLNQMENELRKTWTQCEEVAQGLNISPLLIGSLPTITKEALSLANMSEPERYNYLNEQVFKLRNNEPTMIEISGEKEKLETSFTNAMFVASSTSLQVHIQINQEEASRFYNASLLASIPCVAVAANSPYLFGKKLWEESRIAIFEQGIALNSKANEQNRVYGRVSQGSGYVQESLMEIFWENYKFFPALLPYIYENNTEKLKHLNLHNGTIWRWNRPIICTSNLKKPSIRMEQRVMAAGPTIIDSIANIAFSVGLTSYLANLKEAPEKKMPFYKMEKDFYQAAKKGLNAKVNWLGKSIKLDQLILDELIPRSYEALLKEGISKESADYYLKDILYNRVKSGQTGSQWQQNFVTKYGKDFKALTKSYQEEQNKDIPVYQWKK